MRQRERACDAIPIWSISKGLYRMSADCNLNIQRDQIAYDMQGLEGK
jgi:hypothetical protein